MSNADILRCACGYEASRARMAEHQAILRWWWHPHTSAFSAFLDAPVLVRIQAGDYWDYANGPSHSLLADEL